MILELMRRTTLSPHPTGALIHHDVCIGNTMPHYYWAMSPFYATKCDGQMHSLVQECQLQHGNQAHLAHLSNLACHL